MRRALLLETDGLVCERVRALLRSEGYETCAVDSGALFFQLREQMTFDLYVAGLARPDAVGDLALGPDLYPLVLLVPLEAAGDAAPYRVAAPGAHVVDRRLRDPDGLRRLLASSSGEPAERLDGLGEDPVRNAFEPFGLSERQLEVLARALRGDTSGQIAARLFISELTVRNHLHAIYERTGVSGRRELLGRFVQGLLEANA